MVRHGHEFLHDNPVYLMKELLLVQLRPDPHFIQVGKLIRNRVLFSTTPSRKSDDIWFCDQLAWPNAEPAR